MTFSRRTAGRLLAAAACVSLLAAVPPLLRAAPAQQRVPPFKVAIDYVHVDVVITDPAGAFVRDLTPADFEIYEDGKLQQIASFALADAPRPVPATRAPGAAAAAEPDVTTNAAESGGRVYVLLLDDLHVAALRSARVKEAARQFIEQYLGPNDIAAVIHTSGRRDAGQDFTARRSLLLAAVDKFTGRKLRSRVLEALDEYQRRPSTSSADPRLARATDPLDAERAEQAQRTFQTLESLGDLLARAPGRRKTVLFISEGIDYPLQEGVTQTATGLTAFTSASAPGVLRNFQQAIGAAARANINIYSLDPRGLATTGDESIEVSAFPENPQLGLTPDALQEDLRQAQASLQTLSEQTGGLASVSSNDFGAAFDRLVSDSGTYYMLGYQSSNRRADGTYRRIQVRTKRRGLQVRARAGYLAARRGKSDAVPLNASAEPSEVLRDALNAPLPIAAVPLRIFAAPFRGTGDASVAVGIELDARGFRFVQKDGLYVDRVEVALAALDAQAKFQTGDRQTLNLQLKPETYAAVQARGLRVLFRLNLAPGTYQLRAAVNDTGSGAIGTAFHDVQVPEFHSAPLAISGLAITASRAAGIPTPQMDPVFQAALPSAPTSTRTFYSDETLTVLFEVYREQLTGAAAPVDLTTSVRDAAGRVVFRLQDQVGGDSLPGSGSGFGYTVPIPLKEVPPGAYLLRVEARSRRPADPVAVREVPFTVAALERHVP